MDDLACSKNAKFLMSPHWPIFRLTWTVDWSIPAEMGNVAKYRTLQWFPIGRRTSLVHMKYTMPVAITGDNTTQLPHTHQIMVLSARSHLQCVLARAASKRGRTHHHTAKWDIEK